MRWPGERARRSGERKPNTSHGGTRVPGGWLCQGSSSWVGEQAAAKGWGLFEPHLEPDATRTLEMRLLGWGLGQRCLVLGPAECEAENVAWAWWAASDIQLGWRHRES